MRVKILIGLTLSVMFFMVSMAIASEPKIFDPIATYSSKCAGCHGVKGEGKAIFPKLAGKSKEELAKKLNGYKNQNYGKDRKVIMISKVHKLNTYETGQIAEVIAKF
jgi:cytochrome c